MTNLAVSSTGAAIQAIYPGRVQVVATTAVSAVTGLPFLAATTAIRVVCDVPCHYRLGNSAAAAVVTDSLLPANVVEYINVSRGQFIAFIREGAVSGNAYVTEGG